MTFEICWLPSGGSRTETLAVTGTLRSALSELAEIKSAYRDVGCTVRELLETKLAVHDGQGAYLGCACIVAQGGLSLV